MLDANLENLNKMLSALSEDHLGKKDFLAAWEHILKIILKKEEQLSQAVSRLEETYKALVAKITNDHSENYKSLREQVNELFVGDTLKKMDGETKAEFKKLQSLLRETADSKLRELEGRVGALQPHKGDKGDIGDTGPMPTEHLQLMKDMMAEMKKVQDILTNIPRGKTTGRAKSQVIRAVDLSDQVDGVVTTYTLQPDTVSVLFVYSSQFPQILRPVTDFTLAGRTLTLTAQIGVIQAGQSLTALVDVLFYP